MTLDGCYVVVIISINLCGGALVWELSSCAKDNWVPLQVGSNKKLILAIARNVLYNVSE